MQFVYTSTSWSVTFVLFCVKKVRRVAHFLDGNNLNVELIMIIILNENAQTPYQ